MQPRVCKACLPQAQGHPSLNRSQRVRPEQVSAANVSPMISQSSACCLLAEWHLVHTRFRVLQHNGLEHRRLLNCHPPRHIITHSAARSFINHARAFCSMPYSKGRTLSESPPSRLHLNQEGPSCMVCWMHWGRGTGAAAPQEHCTANPASAW